MLSSCAHSSGAVLKAAHIPTLKSSGLLLPVYLSPLIIIVGEPVTPNSLDKASSAFANASPSEATHSSTLVMSTSAAIAASFHLSLISSNDI